MMFLGSKTIMLKRLGLALAAAILLVPPASPAPLIAVCSMPSDCCPEDCCKVSCGADSEPVGTTRPSQTTTQSAGPAKALWFQLAPGPSAALAMAASRPFDHPNLSAGLRPPLRN
jgi:hypothetical protein